VGSSDEADDDSVTEVNVEVDTSMISEITITRTGASPITVLSGSASPADNEPTTLEPQLGVRGLGQGAMPAPPATVAEAGARRGPSVEDDEDPEEEKTARDSESRVQEAYARAFAASSASPEGQPPRTQLSPAGVTASEPVRREPSDASITRPARPANAFLATQVSPVRAPAPIPAAGRPPEPPELEGERSDVTTRRGPDTPDGKAVADAIRSSAARDADEEDDEEDETESDAMRSELPFGRGPAMTVPLLDEGGETAAEETLTVKAPVTTTPAQASFLDPPLRAAVPDEGRAKLGLQAAGGGTQRMVYNPAIGTASPHPDSERSRVPERRPAQPFGEQPTLLVLPAQQLPVIGAPAIVRAASPEPQEETHGSRRKPRRLGRFVLLFVVACGASGAGVHYRHPVRSWILSRVPSAGGAPDASGAVASASAPDPTASGPVASASAEPSASAVPPGSSAMLAGSAAASAGAIPSASASAQRRKKVPPRK
jgi:hypothetical protein